MEISDLLKNHDSPIDLVPHLDGHKLFVSTSHIFKRVESLDEAEDFCLQNRLILPEIKLRINLFDVFLITTSVGTVTQEGEFMSIDDMNVGKSLWLIEPNMGNPNLQEELKDAGINYAFFTGRDKYLDDPNMLDFIKTIMLKKLINVI